MKYINPTKYILTFPIDFGSGNNEIVILNPEEEIDIPDCMKDVLDQIAPHLMPATIKKRKNK